jgi:hypothetical protein
MSIFDDLEESYFYDSKTTSKESLGDISLDAEEREKIEFEISQSRREIPLRVDYSDFSNHVFFGSAYASVVFAISRLANDYPWDGELKDKNEWRANNNGFENYFFDEIYPKRHGHAFFISGSSPAWVQVKDYEKAMVPHTSSITIECAIKSHENIVTNPDPKKYIFSYSNLGETENVLLFLSSSKDLIFSMKSGSTIELLSASYHSYLSSSHFVSMVYDKDADKQICYIDGQQIVSRSLETSIGPLNLTSDPIIGYYTASTTAKGQFTGSIDEVRYWLSARSPELTKRNFYRNVHANVSGGLKLYYKFNESSQVGSNVIDYSGYKVNGIFTGSFVYETNIKSGTLGSWFKDSGEPIYDTTDTSVSSTLADWQTSGTLYDRGNRNIIYNLVPSFFVEGEQSEETQRFLLLLARHYDRLKLYIDHMVNVYNISHGDFNNTPDELLNFVAKNYGFDIGSVYESVTPLSYFFGEDVLSTGSLDSSLQTIKNQLRRNLLNSLSYITKTKSTRESVEASLRSLGLDENIVEFNEYSIFSGGITNTYKPMSVERRVAYMSGANIFASSSIYNTGSTTFQLRALFNTASVNLTSSLFTIASGTDPVFYLQVERENLSSSNAVAKLYYEGASESPVTSSLLSMFDNNWINFNFYKTTGAAGELYGLHVGKLEYNELKYHFSKSLSSAGGFNTPLSEFTDIFSASIGGSGSYYFDGHMQEFRAWNHILTSSVVDEHMYDFESLALLDFNANIQSSLLSHLKMNDFTGSTTGNGKLNDSAFDYSGSNEPRYVNFSSSAVDNFPGKYIDKLQQTYSYDIGINNDKIRIRDTEIVNKNDVVNDIPFVSIDISPTISLNKEIIRWFGNIEKFNNIIGQPYLKYRDEIEELSPYRYSFFNNVAKSKIKFDVYLNLLKWFDNNFTYFISKLIPLDLASSLSNFVIEPHLFEYNKVKYEFPFAKRFIPLSLESVTSVRTAFDIALVGKDLAFGDPGRFGAALSASAVISSDVGIITSAPLSSSSGLNFQHSFERKILNDYLQNSQSGVISPQGKGNGFYTSIIENSDHLQDILGINNLSTISGSFKYPGGSYGEQLFSATNPPANIAYTGVMNGYVDQRWMMNLNPGESSVYRGIHHDFGIKYGGGFGQLYSVSNKSIIGWDGSNWPTVLADRGIGAVSDESTEEDLRYVRVTEEGEGFKTVVCWPREDYINGVEVVNGGNNTGSLPQLLGPAARFGDRINIDGYDHLNLVVNVEDRTKGTPPAAGEVSFLVKFQFFDEIAGLGTETIISSSIAAGKTIKTIIDNEYLLPSPVAIREFVLSLKRDLPKYKFMRMHITIILLEANSPYNYNILFKAKLTKTGEYRPPEEI